MDARSSIGSASTATRAHRKNLDAGASRRLVAAALAFVSGAAGLIYQVIWIKQLSLVVGADVYAITTAVSAFFTGLALGGLIFGGRADRASQPAKLYIAIEIGIGITGVATTLILANIAPVFVAIESASGLLAWAMVFVLVGIAPLLMGGTLPVLVRAVLQNSGDAGRVGGRLYAANTAGAILGALLPMFVLIPLFGVQGTSIAAATLNVLAAAGATVLGRIPLASARIKPAGRAAAHQPRRVGLAVALYAAAGAIALGYEVIWSQSIVQFMSTRSFAFSVVLATYLAGLAAGAAIVARVIDRIRDPWSVFGLLIAAAGFLALIEIAALGHWLVVAQTATEAFVLRLTENQFAGMCARFAVAAFCIVFVPTLLLGAAFPVALRLVVRDAHIGQDVGAVVAVNTLGGVGGALLTGFVLLPWLGLVHTLALLAIGAGLLGVIACWGGRSSRTGVGLAVAVGAACIVAAVATPSDRFAQLLPAARSGKIMFYEESPGGTVAVVNTGRFRRLYIQGVSNSGDAMPSLRYMRLQALLPLIIHNGEPKSALVIGYGTGITAGALSQFPALDRRVVGELLPAVLRAAPIFDGTFNAASDPGLEKRLGDGRRLLQRESQTYDLITLEPPPPSAVGVVNLYSRDFYRLASSRLNDDGIVAQWLPLPTQNDEDTRALVRSFIDVFPYASLWTSELHEMLLVGSRRPIQLDAERISARFNQPETSAALSAVGVNSVAALIATWITDRDGLVRYAADAPAVTDDRPRIEYATWVRPDEFSRTISHIWQYRSEPPLKGADEQFTASLLSERRDLDAFYRAGLSAYAGNRQAYAREMASLSQAARRNPYYRWFTGSKEP
ncbi:fused MFS/spermidine synthase [Bradyrhizobium sp. 33ap4]|uniref:fused MFS/spermidine synthase n=1 Tax=Bradyrhizobium sp. 33ap4 TaxID=3061630 RepID=UPI00292DDC03|nr:fused MFS/spermidine synthase [Bradyrhizobium sp. 33ap4]